MKLSFEEIKNITVGAVKIWEETDGVYFAKMTDGQLAAYKALSDTLFGTASATTGIRLDFHTDSAFWALLSAQQANMK